MYILVSTESQQRLWAIINIRQGTKPTSLHYVQQEPQISYKIQAIESKVNLEDLDKRELSRTLQLGNVIIRRQN